MRKKNYIFPFVALLILGIITCCAGLFLFPLLRVTTGGYLRVYGVTLVLAAESLVYFLLRKINVFRAASRAHVLLLYARTLVPFLGLFLVEIEMRMLSRARYTVFLRTFYKVEIALTWAMLILAHVFFAFVLVKCYQLRKAQVDAPDPRNLLDDILTGP